MANTRFILNETSYFGFGAREVLLDELKDRGYKRVFLVSDKSLVDAGVTDKVMNILEEGKVRYELYDDVKPNPDGTFNWVCSVCGGIFVQEEEPDYCPLCVKEDVFFYKKAD